VLRGEEEIEAVTALHKRFPQARVTLDMVKVKKAHPIYRQHGLRARDDAAAMQALIPNWTCNPERPAFDR